MGTYTQSDGISQMYVFLVGFTVLLGNEKVQLNAAAYLALSHKNNWPLTTRPWGSGVGYKSPGVIQTPKI